MPSNSTQRDIVIDWDFFFFFFVTCCACRLALEIDSSIAIQPSDSGVGGAISSSSILLLASLPGRLKAQLTELPVHRVDVKWAAESDEEFILLHKSHCLGVCSEETSQVRYFRTRQPQCGQMVFVAVLLLLWYRPE